MEMTVTIVFIIGIFPYVFWNLMLCELSLRYYVDKYKISEKGVAKFIENLNPEFSYLLENGMIADLRDNLKLIDFLIQGNGANPYNQKLILGIISIIPPIGFLFSIFRQEEFIDRILCFIYAAIYYTIFYIAWRFGHSLKPKAQK